MLGENFQPHAKLSSQPWLQCYYLCRIPFLKRMNFFHLTQVQSFSPLSIQWEFSDSRRLAGFTQGLCHMTFLMMSSFAEAGQPSGHILLQCSGVAAVLREDGFYRAAGYCTPEMRLGLCLLLLLCHIARRLNVMH